MKDLVSSKKKIRKYKKAKPSKHASVEAKSRPVSLPEYVEKTIFTAEPKTSKDKKPFRKQLENVIKSLQKKLRTINLPSKHVPLHNLAFLKRHRGLRKFVKQNESDIQLILFPLILLMILITLNVVNSQMFTTIAEEEFHASSVNTKLNPYPFVEALALPKVTANAAIIVDADSQVILFSKNPGLRFSMASTTKIMTALTGLDYYKQDDQLTVKSVGVEGSGLGLIREDQFAFGDLLYAMMLPSANDAAQTVADNYPGGAEAFVQKMNEKAASLNLSKTHFSDASGLDDDGDYTTVVDLARLASYAITNPTFVDITSTKYKLISNRSLTRQYPLNNLNRLLGTEGVTGIKTGTTEGAGEVLVTSTVKNGHTYIIVVMQSRNRFSDTNILMNFIEENVKYVMPPVPQE
ncbi:MAG: D-alanyl-D-alanine carboxypeptidase [Candidatus Levybacteria bacterium]|nr:D-alanyl-D-alanine carboxypeptidase [Candidatus Levybacteria bacterium]